MEQFSYIPESILNKKLEKDPENTLEDVPEKEPEPKNKGFLGFEGHKEDVLESSYNLANYLKTEKIPNVMFLDKSARQIYVGLKEAWKKIGDNEAEPNIYFINPTDLKGETDFSNYEREFDRKYTHLDREEPILLYDACIHSGDALFSTKSFLESLGFKDIKVGVVSLGKEFPEERCSELDLIGLDHRAHAGCHPYGHPMYIDKNGGRVVSQKIDSQMQRTRGREEHQKIKDVFKD